MYCTSGCFHQFFVVFVLAFRRVQSMSSVVRKIAFSPHAIARARARAAKRDPVASASPVFSTCSYRFLFFTFKT